MGLFTTLDDFIKWVQNLENPAVGTAVVRDKLLTSGKLTGGREAGFSYGFAVDSYKGLRRVYKMGAGEASVPLSDISQPPPGCLRLRQLGLCLEQPPTMLPTAPPNVCLEPLLQKPQAPSAAAPVPAKKKPAKPDPAEVAP